MTLSDLNRKYEIIEKLVDVVKDEELNILTKFLRSRIRCPESYVTMLGETSSGKSTIINGLLGEKILKTSSIPTTGTIVEVSFDDKVDNPEYYAINSDATMEKLDASLFERLTINPDDMLKRLKLVIPSMKNLSGLRLFDTPGYGSIVDKHEEVLRDFIPNSDVIIYVVGYKIGIQEDDFIFMRGIQELINRENEIIVVVNRCPVNISKDDKRIKEICKYTKDLFHKDIPLFTVPASNEALPCANDLWAYVKSILESPSREQALINALDGYLNELLSRVCAYIDKLEFQSITSQKEKEELRNYAKVFREKAHKVINQQIEPTFERLIKSAPKYLKDSSDIIYTEISSYIDREDTGKMDETIVYVNTHTLPMSVEREIREYEKRLMLELDNMNKQVDSYLNEAIADYYQEIELHFITNAEIAARASGGKFVGQVMENGLKQYFATFGGAGGAGAGVANAAKHFLKKTGDLFGKKFSRETYNALAHTLKKIGFTSVKAIGNVVTVIIEVAQVVIDYSTWKNKLKKQVKKGINQWYDKTLNTIEKDLTSLKEQNISTLGSIIEDVASAYELNSKEVVDNMSELLSIRKETLKMLKEEGL